MIATLTIALTLFMAVAAVAVATVGAETLAELTTRQAAPLQLVSVRFAIPGLPQWVALGATTAMAGVTLNLILGLSRVTLAMARRGDLPGRLAQVEPRTGTPVASILFVSTAIGLLTCWGDVVTTWSLSAFTVLIYYALTNLAAWRLDSQGGVVPRFIAGVGLASCLGLAFWMEPAIWAVGGGIIAMRFLTRGITRATPKRPVEQGLNRSGSSIPLRDDFERHSLTLRIDTKASGQAGGNPGSRLIVTLERSRFPAKEPEPPQ